jgi:hypothetical protein
MWRVIVMIVVMSLLSYGRDSAAEVSIDVERAKNGFCFLRVLGEIDPQTPSQIQRLLTENRCRNGTFFIHSDGGDVIAAMEAGRIIRQVQGTTMVAIPDNCASACILMFLGGVNRTLHGRIGLHRPYSTKIADSTLEATQAFREINKRIREYLTEMNIPEHLLEVMNSVPPSKINWLSEESDKEELERLHIIGIDPVFEDQKDSATAKLFGISKVELYRRMRQAETVCRKGKENFSTAKGVEEYFNLKPA